MPKTADRRDKARERIIQQVEANRLDTETQLIKREEGKRQATGKKFCPNKYYGYVHGGKICSTCPEQCLGETQKRFQTISEQLCKLFDDDSCYNPDNWIDTTEIDIEEQRNSTIEFVQSKMVEIENDPDLFHKISEIPQLTNKSLDAIVPGWKKFRQQKPKLDPLTIFSGLAGVWNTWKDEVLELVYGESSGDVHEAWSEILENDFYSQSRKQVVTGLHKQLLEYCEQFKATFPAEFGRANKNENYWPAKWMTNDKGMRAMLNRYEHFSAILNIMWRKRKHIDYQGSLNLREKLGLGERADAGMIVDANGKERYCALLPADLTHEDIAKELGKSAQLVQKYLKAMCDIGVIKRFHQKGRNPFTVYSIGYWVEWENKQRVMPFLQQKKYGKKESPEMYQRLIDFKVAFNTGQ
ncbi:MAG: winged helix-turn-helix transcriptional regulator [Geobacter sp.]|nr:MAG: winged helix-turn-helix transcriptional regulator [Geobacter sp.]